MISEEKDIETPKRKKFSLVYKIILGYICILCCLWTALWLMYRIPDGDPITIEGELFHHIIIAEFDFRHYFERFHGHRHAFLIDDTGTKKKFWISRKEYYALVDSAMKSEGQYTYKLTVEMCPLYFGGYGISRIVHCEKIPGRMKYFK